MILWTVQPYSWWTCLKENGRITVDLATLKSHPTGFYEDRYEFAYGWLIEQMEQKLPVPRPHPTAYPIWAWYQWLGAKRKAPDLRFERHRTDSHRVRIKFEIDHNLVLLSDYESWHFVLNNWNIPEKETDWDSELPSYTEEEKRKTWNRVFELDWTHPLEGAEIQATFWELRLDQVKDAREFGKIPHRGKSQRLIW